MRPRLRTRRTVWIARPLPLTDALGGVREGFSAARLTAPAAVMPINGALPLGPAGVWPQETCSLLLPPDTDIRPRDGVWLGESTAEPPWRCLRVERWPLHLRAVLERRRSDE